MAVAESLIKHAAKISSPEMTAELEADMDGIAAGSKSREDVVDRSRQMLSQVMLSLVANQEAVGSEIRGGILEGKTVGVCSKCASELRIIRAKKTKKRFVGCSKYPDCDQSYPLPQFGEIIPLGGVCDQCGSPKIKVVSKGKRPWELCLDPSCPTKEAYRSRAKK